MLLIQSMIGVVQQRRTDTIAKILILTFNDDEEKAIEKVLSVLSDEIGQTGTPGTVQLPYPDREIMDVPCRPERAGGGTA